MCESKHRSANKKAAVSAVNFALKLRERHGRAESLESESQKLRPFDGLTGVHDGGHQIANRKLIH